MSKQIIDLQRRKDAQNQLNQLNEHRIGVFVIHYSCESFYNLPDGRTSRVTSIAVRNFTNGQTQSFSIHKEAELRGFSLAEISGHYDELEKAMLESFYGFLKLMNNHFFVHWNMRDEKYGFHAIEHRFRVLKGVPVVMTNAQKFDLARIMFSKYGEEYIDHGGIGNMLGLAKLNKMTDTDALNGAEEAQAFNDQKFVQLHQSTLRKVDIIANILERTIDGSLKTHAPWSRKYGFHPAIVVDFIKGHWLWTLIGIIATVLTVVGGFWMS